ncbi:MAG: heme ABC exporter ATP-binding protein CcmA [bacterium JZ-2024 1]
MRAVRMGTTEALVWTEDVTRRYGHSYALRGVTLSVAPGEIVALVGPNGSGKTTLLRILATLVQPTSGEVRLFGLSPRLDGPRIRRRLSYLGHNPGLYDDLTAMENLVFFSRLYSTPANEARLTHMLAEFGLKDRKDDPVKAFSRGMKQRLALARSAALNAELYLWDEPLTGLDSRAVDTVLESMNRLRDRGASVVFSSHILPHPLPSTTRIVYLENGRVTDRPQAVLTAVISHTSALP